MTLIIEQVMCASIDLQVYAATCNLCCISSIVPLKSVLALLVESIMTAGIYSVQYLPKTICINIM